MSNGDQRKAQVTAWQRERLRQIQGNDEWGARSDHGERHVASRRAAATDQRKRHTGRTTKPKSGTP